MMTNNQIGEILFKLRVYLITVSSLAVSIFIYISTASGNLKGEKILNVVALGMIPACLIGILWEAFIKKAFVQYIEEMLNVNAQINTYGIKGIFSHRGEIPLLKNIKEAKKRIWILLTSFSYLTETPGIQEELIHKATTKDIELRVLGLNPDSESARLRSAFNDHYKNLEQEIPVFENKFIEGFERKKEKIQDTQISLYNKIPTCGCFIIDNQMYLCPLLCSERGRNSVHILISHLSDRNKVNKLFTEYEEHFSVLFKEAEVIFPKNNGSKKPVSTLEAI
jgi:hypothetical protein